MNETIGITAFIFMILVNIVGWGYTLWQSSRSSSKHQGKYEERLNGLVADMGDLPCKSNPEFQLDMGAMIQKLNDIDRRMGRIEGSLDIPDGG